MRLDLKAVFGSQTLFGFSDNDDSLLLRLDLKLMFGFKNAVWILKHCLDFQTAMFPYYVWIVLTESVDFNAPAGELRKNER